MNFFELYELPIAVQQDKALVKRKYLLLSKKYHPDYFDAANGITEEENMKLSAAVNEGYKIFQEEQTLLGYILLQKEIIVPDEKYALSPDFLMEMMELNEEWNDASATKVKALEEEITKPVQNLLSKDNLDNLTNKEWLSLKDFYYKRKYIRRLENRAKGIEVEM